MNTVKKKILILGYKSFAGTGLDLLIQNEGFEVDCFTRGPKEIKDGNIIYGDAFALNGNNYFRSDYDYIINFIIIKNESVEKNLGFIKELIYFCNNKKVKKLFQISSISVYNNLLNYVNECTPIDLTSIGKGSYASIKTAVDDYLLTFRDKLFEVIFIRPGYIINDNNNRAAKNYPGISLNLPFNVSLLLGNRSTTLPLIHREIMHSAIIRIIKSDKNLPVYLLLDNKATTKYSFLKSRTNGVILTLPRTLIIPLAKLLFFIKIINETTFLKILGLFKSTKYDSSITEKNLELSFY